MKGKEENIDLIDRYLAGELSDKETSILEQQLASDNEFSELYQNHLDTIAHFKTYHFRTNIQGIQKNYLESQPKPKSTWIYISGIAATIALVLVSYLLFQVEEVSSGQLFQTYFTPYQSIGTVRGDEDSLSQAINYYELGQYDSTILLLSHIGFEAIRTEKMTLLLGVSYLAVKDFKNALETLDKIRASKIYSEQVDWYRALGHLGANDTEMALKELKAIGSGAYKYDEAQEVIKNL